MNNLIEIDINELGDFNYEQLDADTADKLKDITIGLSAINSNFKYNVGRQLNEAQELLAKNGYGCFREWFQSYGLKRDKVYDWIRYYKVFVGNSDNQKKLKELSDSKIYELGKLKQEQQKEILENANLSEMTTQEVKELTKKLKQKEEHTKVLQEQIQEKELQINKLKDAMKNIQIPEKEIIEKEVIKEVVPESIKSQVECLEKEKAELFQKYEEAKSTIVSMNNMKNCEIGQKYYDYGFDELSLEIADFLRKTSKYAYMDQEYSELNSNKKTLIKNGIKKIENWLIDMKKAMNESLMIGNNIYVEGGNEDE